jgi:hypothetical protein
VTTRRVITAVAVAMLAALVAAATSLATASSGTPRAIVASHLAVGAGPPSTATAVLHYADSSGISIAATLVLDVPDDAAQLAATATLSLVSASMTIRTVHDEAYVEIPAFASMLGGPWTAAHTDRGAGEAALVARFLRHPDLGRLHPTTRSTVRDGLGTRTSLDFAEVTVPQLGLPLDLPARGSLALEVVTGPQGQLLSAAITLSNATDRVHATLVVTGYDQPVTIVAPAASQVVALDTARADSILGTSAPSLLRTLRSIGVDLGAG